MQPVHVAGGCAMNRNDPCPCGSGKRYKQCHGVAGAPPLPGASAAPPAPAAAAPATATTPAPAWAPRGGPSRLHLDAVAAHRAGALAQAEALYRKALAADPGDAASLHLLGAVMNDRFRRHAAMEYIAQAAELTGWQMHVVLSDLASVLATMLSPRANPAQQALVAAYRERETVRKRAPVVPGHVSVVLVGADRDALAASLASVMAQSYADVDVVLVDTAPVGARTVAPEASRFPVQRVAQPGASDAEAANAGARVARGPWLAFLTAGDRFAPERLDKLVDAMAHATPLWGYSRVVDEVPAPVVPGSEGAPAVPDALTPGFSLLVRDVAGAADNLFVPRDFFVAQGGFRDVGAARGWDFRLRATMHAEPVFVDEPLYRRGPRSPAVSPADASRIAEVLTREALAGRAGTTNPLGAWMPAHRDVVLRWLLKEGRGRYVPVPELQALVAYFRAGAKAPRTRVAEGETHGQDRRAVVVLGVYRSGTSALTRVLNLCGVMLPEAVHAPQMGLNPTGFWETEDVTDLDSRFMEQLGGKWNRVDFELPTSGPVLDEFLEDAQSILAEVYHDAPLILIKDPRIAALGPAWHRALVQHGYRPGYVVTVRHPLEVAKSMRAGGGGTLAENLALWSAFMTHMENFAATVDAPVLHMTYEMLLADWRAVIGRIARRLAVPLSLARADELDRFLDGSLHNQRASDAELVAAVGQADADRLLAQYARLVARADADAA
ncbi:MAG: SEC-C domain-containing protein [Proteobacteria bacterium]|nr:SEC-C domain-containing protein [Pseudomonadota bacterium]